MKAVKSIIAYKKESIVSKYLRKCMILGIIWFKEKADEGKVNASIINALNKYLKTHL
jgi:hypothetical protein